MNAVIECIEEEYVPFFAWPIRRRNGWKWLPINFRGPTWPGPLGFLFTLVGIWRFARRPRRLVDIPKDEYLGCEILTTSGGLGSYGMGGPGFFGLKCIKNRKTFWMVFTLWAAEGWLTLDNKLIESSLSEDEKKNYARRGIISIKTIHGGTIESIDFSRETVSIKIANNDQTHMLELRRDGSAVLPWRGTGDKKKFRDHELLEDALVISRRARLWTED